MTRITVGVTVKDDRDGMTRLLDALARQTRPPDEMLVVDAASMDGTREACEAFARKAPFPVRVASAPCTRGAARDRILREATGDLVAFTDADCEPPPGWLAEFERAWTRLRDEEPRLAALGGPNWSAPGANPLQRAVDDVMGHTEAASFGGVNTCNALYDRDAALAAGSFDPSLNVAEDPDVNARLRRRGHVLRRVDNPVLQRRRATWRALVRQHHAYGQGAWTLLSRYPEDFPGIERRVGLILAAGAAGGLLLALAHPAFLLVAVAALVAPPLVVHRRLAWRFLREHGPSMDLLRRLGVLWVVYVPYHVGTLVARLRGRA